MGTLSRFVATALSVVIAAVPAHARPDADLKKLEAVIVEATASNKPAAVVTRFEPEFAAAYAKANKDSDPSGVGSGWITNADEPNLDAIQLTIESKVDKDSEKSAIITITFLQDGESFRIDYLVHKSNDTWLIYDVTYPDEAFSLREFVLPH